MTGNDIWNYCEPSAAYEYAGCYQDRNQEHYCNDNDQYEAVSSCYKYVDIDSLNKSPNEKFLIKRAEYLSDLGLFSFAVGNIFEWGDYLDEYFSYRNDDSYTFGYRTETGVAELFVVVNIISEAERKWDIYVDDVRYFSKQENVEKHEFVATINKILHDYKFKNELFSRGDEKSAELFDLIDNAIITVNSRDTF